MPDTYNVKEWIEERAKLEVELDTLKQINLKREDAYSELLIRADKAEARVVVLEEGIVRDALAWEKVYSDKPNARDEAITEMNLLSRCREYRAAIDDAREK
jgi:hypothetical protein